MRLLSLIFICFCFSNNSFAQADYHDYEEVIAKFEKMKKAARTGKFKHLKNLCDPLDQNDMATECICSLYKKDKENRCEDVLENREQMENEYMQGFSRIFIERKILIRDGYAQITYLKHPDSQETGKLLMVKRDDVWYLWGFSNL